MNNESKATEYNMKMVEIGPRFDMDMYKIEEGFLNNTGNTIYHSALSEVEAMKIKKEKYKD